MLFVKILSLPFIRFRYISSQPLFLQASVPGLVLPPLGVILARAANGSWTPLFSICAAITMVTGVGFYKTASLTSGRELLAQRAEATAARSKAE